MGAVFGVEVVQIGLMLEVVGVDGAVLDNIVGDDIVVVLLNVQGDVLCGKNFLARPPGSQRGESEKRRS